MSPIDFGNLSDRELLILTAQGFNDLREDFRIYCKATDDRIKKLEDGTISAKSGPSASGITGLIVAGIVAIWEAIKTLRGG